MSYIQTLTSFELCNRNNFRVKMNLQKTSLSIATVFLLVLQSCSIEKRVHMKGYHVTWSKISTKVDKLKQEDLAHTKIMETMPMVQTKSENENIRKISVARLNEYDDTNLSRKNTSPPTLITPKGSNLAIIRATQQVNKLTNETPLKKKIALKKQVKSLEKMRVPAPSSGSGALRGLGWFVIIIGVLVLILASILAGALLMLLGLVFVISGSKDTSVPPQPAKEEKKQYVDVVYLKNGSVIRGIIIEQVPNVSIKIETAGGSVFVYKMEEVERMTKELER